MGLTELCWTVQGIAHPGHFANLAQGGLAAEVPKDLLQVREFLSVPPDHEVGGIAHSREVIDSAHGHLSSFFNVGEELLRLGDDLRSLGAERARNHLKNRVLGVLLNRVEFLVVKLRHCVLLCRSLSVYEHIHHKLDMETCHFPSHTNGDTLADRRASPS